MSTAGIAELKAGLSRYLDRVKAGEEVIITERGKAIARIVPIAGTGPTPAELEDLIRSGAARPPLAEPNPILWETPGPADPEGRMLKALLEERESGW